MDWNRVVKSLEASSKDANERVVNLTPGPEKERDKLIRDLTYILADALKKGF